MTQAVPRTIALNGSYVAAAGALLVSLALVLPVWSVRHRTHKDVRIEFVGGPMRPAMIVLPQMPDGTTFAIAESEVTQIQFHRVMHWMPPSVAHPAAGSWLGCPGPMSAESRDVPITCVSISDAVQYASRLTAFENRARALQNETLLTSCYADLQAQLIDRACTGYRLPKVEEWTHAANAGEDPLSLPGDPPYRCDFAHLPNCSQAVGPRPVMTLRPSAWHLYDMLGNAAEMVVLAQGAPSRAGKLGGSWNENPITTPGANPLQPTSDLGFRVVRNIRN